MADKDTQLYESIYGALAQPGFEGASTSYRNELKGLVSGDPDSIAVKEILYLQMRIAHAIRNNGYALTAFDKYKTNLGAVKVNWKNKQKKQHARMQEIWDEFAADPNLDGYGTLDNTQTTWHGSIFQSGNSFTRLQIRRKKNPNRVPLKLEPLLSETHDIGYMGKDTESLVRFGIEFNDSKPINYFFRNSLIYSYWYNLPNSNPQIVIPASEILHIFHRQYPGQWVGVPLLSSILITLYELDDLTDATIAKQKAAQAIAWIIENTNPIAMTPVGAPTTVQDKDKKDKVIFKANGGNVQYLNKGEKINFYQSTDIGSNLPILVASELRKIAASIGIPYYQLTGDYDGIDYSTLRGIAIELRNRIEYIHHFYTIPIGLNPLALYVKNLASLYNKRVSDAIPTFQLPRWYGVDELKDAQADVLEVQNGMSTLQSKLDERHLTFEDIIEDRQKMKEIGLDNLLTPKSTSTSQNNNIQANPNSSGN